MISRTIRYLVALFALTFSLSAVAQKDYRMEAGVLGGSSLYFGDSDINYPNNAELTFGGLLRYRFDQRFALKAEGIRNRISGTYPRFRSDYLTAFDLCGEFNFLNYFQRIPERSAERYSTYIFGGLGAMLYDYESSMAINPNISFGVGFKMKLGKRFNLNAQYANRLLLADNMEGIAALNNKAQLNGSNFLNNDLLMSFTLALTYDFWIKDCKCVWIQ